MHVIGLITCAEIRPSLASKVMMFGDESQASEAVMRDNEILIFKLLLSLQYHYTLYYPTRIGLHLCNLP